MGRDALGCPRRRTVLRALAGGSLLPLAGCTVLGTGYTTETAMLSPTDGEFSDQFGWSVALAENDDTALIGNPSDDRFTEEDMGAAYVFEWANSGWTQQAKLVPADGDENDAFGSAVALAGDIALISADTDEDPSGSKAGAAYVFERTSDGWAEAAKLAPNNGDRHDIFGRSVALAEDGGTALIGAPNDESPTGEDAVMAYVFKRASDGWTVVDSLFAADGDATNIYGVSVALAGGTALVGTPFDDSSNGENVGAAYMFERTNSGRWTESAMIAPADSDSADRFGGAVALSEKGDTALIGAQADDDPNGKNAGAAYVFERVGSEWTEAVKLTPANGDTEDFFGASVALADDGTMALIGAYHDDDPTGESPGAGAAYLFEQTTTGWTETATLASANGDALDRFGSSVALRGDTTLIGSPNAHPNGKRGGAAYVFDL